MISIAIADQQSRFRPDSRRLRKAVRHVLKDAGYTDAAISLAIVDDPTIHDLNRRFLAHDFPTDVITFALDDSDGRLEGEIVVSTDTAAHTAAELGWQAEDELLLYVIHGSLHLAGFDDTTKKLAEEMRRQERHYLSLFGLEPPTAVTKPKATKPKRALARAGKARR